MKLKEILEPLKKDGRKSKTPDQTDLNQKILKKRRNKSGKFFVKNWEYFL